MSRNNKIRKLHSSAQPNRIGDGRSRWKWAAAIAAVAALAVGGTVAYSKLHDIWIGQCVVEDVSRQVTVNTGAHIKAGLILDQFGIRKGANLALIDFAARRRAILEKLPNIRALTVERQLPERVTITVEEREPVARMNVRGNKSVTGRVVDSEGVVFLRQAGTSLLPVIVERAQGGTAVGKKLDGRGLAALKVLEAAGKRECSELGVLVADATPQDYLLLTFGPSYSRAKFAWDGMETPTTSSEQNLASQLKRLLNAARANLDGGSQLWNATIQGIVTVDTKEPIL